MSLLLADGRRIGADAPAYLIAEIGINHNGDLDLAKRTIDAAAKAGADAVKFQNYRTEDFLVGDDLTHAYVSQGRRVVESQREMFRRCELTSTDVDELNRHCREQGIAFVSTPTNIAGVRQLAALGVPFLKNGSDYLTNLELLSAMATTGLPVVVSTGMATAGEIGDALSQFDSMKGGPVILLVCTSSYPADFADLNLRRIPSMAAAFGRPVGFSDHSSGIVAAIVAVTLGACLVEKHFTLDRSLPGPDHSFSSDPAEFAALVHAVRATEAALGISKLGPTPSETKSRSDFRLSCVATRDIPTGTVITRDDVAFSRPGIGIEPKLIAAVVGLRTHRPIATGKPLTWECFHE